MNVPTHRGSCPPRPSASAALRDPRSPRRATVGAARMAGIVVAALVLAGCVATRSPLPTLRPLPSSTSGQAGAGAAAGTAVAVTPGATAPNPLGPGLGLPSPGASLPEPILIRPPAMAPPLWLTRTDTGTMFDWSSMRGKPTILYFGYSHCPDVCPAALGVIRDAVAKAGVPVQVVFVTVDPTRDTPAVLTEYLGYFGQGWIGLVGSDGITHQAIELYGGNYQKLVTATAAPTAGGSGTVPAYAVGHTTDIYLIDQQGNWVETFPFGASSDQVIAGLRAISTPGG